VKQSLLKVEEVLAGYDAVSPLYPYVPPINLWRAWEYAAYRRYRLDDPVLDIGCGDGRFFRLVWPGARDVTGVDIAPGAVEAARQSGVYSQLHLAAAHRLPVAPESFASAFANCSLEHMDNLPEVLRGICRSLRPGGRFVLSVVTGKFIEWATLPLLVSQLGDADKAQRLRDDYGAYHHLVNPLPIAAWIAELEAAGFEVREHVPIVPELTSRLFLFLDNLWHVKNPSGEIGNSLSAYLAAFPNFPRAFREVFAGVMRMERDWATGSGAVFLARRRK
jgi:SAM-dependent methyltransferase